MSKPVKSVLVFRGGALGDVLVAGPALMRLRKAFPDASITLAARTAYSELFLDTLQPLELLELGSARFSPLFLENATLPEDLVRFIASFDVVVSWLGPSTDPFARNLLRAGAKRLVAVPAFPESPASSRAAALHVADHLLGSLKQIGLAPDRETFELRLPSYNAQTCDHLLNDCGVNVTEALLAVHPGSGSAAKCWPTERFVHVAAKLAETRDMQVLWMVGPAETEHPERFCAGLPGAFVVMASLPILMLAGCLQRARVYLGNDSGVTHLAAAVGTPTLALFGPTSPKVWAPQGEHVEVLHKPNLARLQEQTVLETLLCMTEPLDD